jgi:hypothetical protein
MGTNMAQGFSGKDAKLLSDVYDQMGFILLGQEALPDTHVLI